MLPAGPCIHSHAMLMANNADPATAQCLRLCSSSRMLTHWRTAADQGAGGFLLVPGGTKNARPALESPELFVSWGWRGRGALMRTGPRRPCRAANAHASQLSPEPALLLSRCNAWQMQRQVQPHRSIFTHLGAPEAMAQTAAELQTRECPQLPCVALLLCSCHEWQMLQIKPQRSISCYDGAPKGCGSSRWRLM